MKASSQHHNAAQFSKVRRFAALIALSLTLHRNSLAGDVRFDASREVLDRLVSAYPDFLTGHDGKTITWRDGTTSPVGDQSGGKSFDQILRNATVLDQFRLVYPTGKATQDPALNFDPGRFRNQALFDKMYGDCDSARFLQNLVSIIWLPRTWGKTVQVTKINGIAERLRAISDEIDRLDPSVKRAAYPIAGVLSCRTVADTGKRSMHAYAAAIDLNLEYSSYWLWQKKKGAIEYRNRMPYEIVEIFERHGFIWGGKWYHYDAMHFEYRPELIGSSAAP